MMFGLVMALAAGPSSAGPSPVCGSAEGIPESGCWLPLEGKRQCYVWNGSPEPNESAEFEGRSRCRGGKLSGTGTLTSRWTIRGEERTNTSTGTYSEGRKNGRFVEARSDGYRGEGEYLDGEPHGNWINRFPPAPNRWDRVEASWINGKRHGRWVFTNPRRTKEWERLEGSYANGKRVGQWVYSELPGTEGKWDRLVGAFVDGQRHGEWVYTDYEKVDGRFVETRREVGPVLQDFERHGDWDLIQRSFGTAIIEWSHRNGTYVEDQRQGRWVELSSTALRDRYDALNEEAAYKRDRAEGDYRDGRRHGDWTIVAEEVEVWGDVLAETAATRSIRREGAYAEGQRHGVWKVTMSDGRQIVEKYERGMLHGSYEAKDSSGSVIVAASLEGGKVTDLRLPIAALPLMQSSGSTRSPVVGGFGIELGPDVEQLRQLKCGDDTCITTAFWTLRSVLESFEQAASIPGLVYEVPAPITRGRQYDFSVSPWIGISQVRAWLHFESADACERDKIRIDGLLREKYGECRDYRFEAESESRKPIGQCDADGLPVAVVRARCSTWDDWDSLILSYAVLDAAARQAVLQAEREKGEVNANEL